jgi:hypothetical protein
VAGQDAGKRTGEQWKGRDGERMEQVSGGHLGGAWWSFEFKGMTWFLWSR